MLILLDEREDNTATFKELERSFGVSQPTMAGIIRRLKQKNLVETLTDSDDRRIKMARLTQDGLEKCREGYQYMAKAEEMILADLTEEERNELLHLLTKIHESLV